MASDEEEATAFNPKRRLCPDGSCIGLIGGDGRCSACGRSAGGHPAQAEDATEPHPKGTPAADDGLDIDTDEEEARPGPGSAFDPHRRLCSDGTCVGVIGQNNRCQVCGKPA
jgi:hypothetical protein